MKILTVTVPCYNSEGYMRNCIESLLVEKERIEIIIIDDGSKDGTGAIADEYVAKYPDAVRVIHQENEGHGGGINRGIENATCKYFKVVDSDDKLNADAFKKALDALEQNDVDMLISNYVYTHEDPSLDRVISFRKAFKSGVVSEWGDMGKFGIKEYLTIHSSTFRTQCLRDSGLKLPLHLFYEDNLYVFTTLPYVKKLIYLDVDLYCYTIGREGQSVQEKVIAKRYKHQLEASKRLFCAHDYDKIENKKLRKYLLHEAKMLLIIASVFARINKTQEAEEDLKNMWRECIEFSPKYAKKIKNRSIALFMNLPGKFGRAIGLWLYRLAQKIVKFNE